MAQRRLAFKGVNNLRDLGGYPVGINESTKFNTFFRSDDLSEITKEEIEILKERGLNKVIDLRSNKEVKVLPSPLAVIEGIEYCHYHLAKNIDSDWNTHTLADFYLELVKDKSVIKGLFELLADSSGSILFNCSAGKDRTGVTAMLLLGLVGVEKRDILADYQITYTYIKPKVDALMKTFPDMPQHITESKVEWMEKTLDYLYDNYGSIYNYLVDCEIGKETLEKIKQRFIEENN